MAEGVTFDRASADRIARAVQWVEQNQGGARSQPRRAHKTRARSTSDPILTFTHNASSGRIVIEQNGWTTDNASPWPDYGMHIGNLVNDSLQISDAYSGTFVVAAYVQFRWPTNGASVFPVGAGTGFKFELVQNAEAESSAAGSDHHIGLSNAQLGVYQPDGTNIGSWYMSLLRTTTVPLAVVKVAQTADSSSAGPTSPTITHSMISRAALHSHLQRLATTDTIGWDAQPQFPLTHLYCNAGKYFLPQNTPVYGAASGLVWATIAGVSQPWKGYLVVRWRAGGASPAATAVAVSTTDYASDYGAGKTYNGYPLASFYLLGGRVVEATTFHTSGGAMVPSIRSPNSVTDSGNDRVVFENGIQTGYTAQDSAL